MNKILKITGIAIVSLAALGSVGFNGYTLLNQQATKIFTAGYSTAVQQIVKQADTGEVTISRIFGSLRIFNRNITACDCF